MNRAWLLGLLALAAVAGTPNVRAQEEVVAGLSQNQISISTNFDGSEILIFGAVKRETAIDPLNPLSVIVTVSGPRAPVMVRRKDRVAGIWVNTDSVEIDAAPSFYAVATTAPLTEILSSTEDLRHKVSVPRAIRSVGAPASVEKPEIFTDALIRLRSDADLYQVNEESVFLTEQTLFSTSVDLPANLVEGNYTVRFLLTRDRAVVSDYETVIFVQKVGLERFLYNLAHEQPMIYGLLSLFIAIAAGWVASAVFRFIRT